MADTNSKLHQLETDLIIMKIDRFFFKNNSNSVGHTAFNSGAVKSSQEDESTGVTSG